MMHAHWSLGVLIGLPFAALSLLVGLALVVGGVWWVRTSGSFDRDLGWIALGLGVLMVPAVLLITIFTFWPFKASYHRWEPKTGTVAEISNRFLGDGSGGTSQRFVVTLAGSPQQYACDDTRCSLLKVGDPLTLSCKKEYQYASEPGYGCRWVKGGAR